MQTTFALLIEGGGPETGSSGNASKAPAYAGNSAVAAHCNTFMVFPQLNDLVPGSATDRLSDAQLRAALIAALHGCYEKTDTRIVNEMPISSGYVRADVATLNGHIAGFEIKSDHDSLKRLNRQIRAYASIFDRVTIVTTERHVKAVLKDTPQWCGVVVARRAAGEIILYSRRDAMANPDWDIRAVLALLWQSELRQLGKAHGVARASGLPKDVIIAALTRHAPADALREASIGILKARPRHGFLAD